MSAPSTPLSRAKEKVGVVLKGKWHLDAVIGVGGMAAVFAATHRNGSRVAIKVLNPEYAAQPEFVARFMREGYVANKINHTASVTVIDDDNDEGCAFLVMELLTGHSLERYARRGGKRLPLAEILRVSDVVLDLLGVAHGLGILHRDIKPANILVTEDGRVKVLDFGIARLAERIGDASATQTGTSLGTPAYMPPEQARGRWNLVDPRTDLWALGATMHALVLGDRPRRAETVQEEMLLAMTEPLASLRDAAPAAPPRVIALIERATALEMDARWANAATMQRELRDIVANVNVAAIPSLAPGAVSGPPGREGGSGSGPRIDTAPMVPPSTPMERETSTLHATENTAPPVLPPTKTRGAMIAGIGAGVVVVALLLGVRAFLHAPTTAAAGADSFGGAEASSAPSAPSATSALLAAAAPPPPLPPAAATPPPAPQVPEPAASVIELEADSPAPRAPSATQQVPSAAPATPTAKATSQGSPPRPKPTKKSASPSIYDERF